MTSHSKPQEDVPRPRFLRSFLALMALGLPGVLLLVPVAQRQLEAVDLETSGLSVELLVFAALAQTALLLAASVALGLATAPKVGFASLLVDRVSGGAPVGRRLRRQAPLAIALGLGTGGAMLLLDAVLLPLSGVDAEALQGVALDPVRPLLLGLFYGGITEELLMRWGLMSLFAWLGSRLPGLRTSSGRPKAGVAWSAIVVTALLFGIGHLPALAAAVPLTPVLVIRTIALNALGALVFGWLFWRRSLEAAMLSHASVHVAFALGAALTDVLSG